MVTRRDRSSVDAETHRLKNRLRQQRYRARKREEKAKRDGETILPSCLSITGFTNATHMPWVSTPDEIHSNTDNVGARIGSRSSDVDHAYGETDSSRLKPIVGWQHKQQCNVESVPSDAEGDTINRPENCHTFQLHRIQPLCQMESELSINNLKMQDGYSMKPLDQTERRRSDEDIMARRLKNRERQRRYRARKRLEAAETTKQTHHLNQSTTTTSLPLATQPSGGGIITERVITRTHCERNWKKDARKAHLFKEPEKSSPPALLNLNPENDNQKNSSSPTENKEKPIPEDELQADDNQVVSFNNSESSATATLGRRDWKVAARNKAD